MAEVKGWLTLTDQINKITIWEDWYSINSTLNHFLYLNLPKRFSENSLIDFI